MAERVSDAKDVTRMGRSNVARSGMGGLNPRKAPDQKGSITSSPKPQPTPHKSTRFTG